MANHSWMSDSNYGGTEKGSAPKEKIQYGEAGQNMDGDIALPDTELKENIIAALENDMHIDTSDISVEVNYGKVTLTGTVFSRGMLRAVSECVHNVPGVVELINDLKIEVGNF